MLNRMAGHSGVFKKCPKMEKPYVPVLKPIL